MDEHVERLLLVHDVLKKHDQQEVLALLKTSYEFARAQSPLLVEAAVKKLPQAMKEHILAMDAAYWKGELSTLIVMVGERKPGLLVYSVCQPTLIRRSTFEKYTAVVQKLIDHCRVQYALQVQEHTLLDSLCISSKQEEEKGIDSCFTLEADCGEYPINQDDDTGLVYNRTCTNSQNFDFFIKTCMLALKVLVPECQIYCTIDVQYHALPPAETDWQPAVELYQQLFGSFHLFKGPWGKEIGRDWRDDKLKVMK